LENLEIMLISQNVVERLEKGKKSNFLGIKQNLKSVLYDFVEKVINKFKKILLIDILI
jgi:hypothetical protein